jgi:hypothetical protein
MQRRNFLKQSGLLAAGAFALNSSDLFANSNSKIIKTFGVQLYSVRDVLPKDPKGVMTQLAQMGYKQFESYGGAKGFLWGMTPKKSKLFGRYRCKNGQYTLQLYRRNQKTRGVEKEY